MKKTLARSIVTYSFFWSLFLAQCVTIFYCMINSPTQIKVLGIYGLIIWVCALLGGIAIVSKRALTIDRFKEKLASKTGLSDVDIVKAVTLSQRFPLFASTLYFIMWNVVHVVTFMVFKALNIGNLSALSLLGGWLGGVFSCSLMVFGVLSVITIPTNTIFYDEISKRKLDFKGLHFTIKSKLVLGIVIICLSLVVWLGGAAFYTGVIQIVHEMKSSELQYIEYLTADIKSRLGNSISVDSLKKFLNETNVAGKELFIADKTGRTLYSEKPTTLFVEKWEDINQEIKNGFQKKIPKSIYENIHERVITFSPIDDVYILGTISHISNKINRFGPFIFWFLFFCIVGLFVGLINGYALIIGTTRSINNTSLKLKQLSEDEGDLTKRISMSSEDELGDMTRYFNAFMEKLREIILNISNNASILNESSAALSEISSKMSNNIVQMKDKSGNVSGAAEEVSLNMATITAAMEQTSVNTGHVANAVEEMTATINSIAANSGKALQITREAVVQSQTATDKMDKMGEAANSIGKVTEVITEISEQTNLLALNATIEAARAGEAGKGFAVVANEIKELAKQTAEATLEIKNQISEMQKTTKESIEEINQISKTISNVNEITTGIASAVEEQSVTTKEIAGNIIHASKGIEEVKNSINQVSTASKSISSDISSISESTNEINEDSAMVHTNSDNLMQLAGRLKQTVAKFTF